MDLSKAEAQALVACCQIFLRNNQSDLVEHLLWRLSLRFEAVSL